MSEWRAARSPRQPLGGRQSGEDRREQLLTAGLKLAEKVGFERVTRDLVAMTAGCSPTLLSRYWTAPAFQTAMMYRAVATGNLAVLAQGLAVRHPSAVAAPFGLRQAAVRALVGTP